VVKSLQDVSVLRLLGNISGAITSRALFGGVFTLPEAIAIASEPTPAPAPFL
jgi:phosphoribosylformimino-5-aminoimidazole carboxamide ribonucleotide (ProFAR) isomerase